MICILKENNFTTEGPRKIGSLFRITKSIFKPCPHVQKLLIITDPLLHHKYNHAPVPHGYKNDVPVTYREMVVPLHHGHGGHHGDPYRPVGYPQLPYHHPNAVAYSPYAAPLGPIRPQDPVKKYGVTPRYPRHYNPHYNPNPRRKYYA